MTKIAVERASRDLERLKPHLEIVFESVWQRKIAAKLNSHPQSQEGISKALTYFLVASIAAVNHVTPVDRIEIKKMVKSRSAATRNLEAACLAWKQYSALHEDLAKALTTSRQHEALAQNALAELGKLQRGARRYRAFDKFARALAHHYQVATGQKPIVKLDSTRGYDDRCSGAFAELLEECFDQAKKIWNASGFEKHLPAPPLKGGRLDYARKALQPKRTLRRGCPDLC